MKYLEKQIFNILKEIEKLIKNGENEEIEKKRDELDKLLRKYTKKI